MTNFDLLFSFLEIMLWLHIVLGVTISHDPLLQKAYSIQVLFCFVLFCFVKFSVCFVFVSFSKPTVDLGFYQGDMSLIVLGYKWRWHIFY